MPADPTPARKPNPGRPGLLRREAAAAWAGVSVATWDRMAAAGEVPAAVRMGTLPVWRRVELREWQLHDCPPRSQWVPIRKALLAARKAARRK